MIGNFAVHQAQATTAPVAKAPTQPPPNPFAYPPIEQKAEVSETHGGSERIVTTTTGDILGFDVPSYLRQYSAEEAIKQISRDTGIPYDELTSDGHSIPAKRPKSTGTADKMAALGFTVAFASAPTPLPRSPKSLLPEDSLNPSPAHLLSPLQLRSLVIQPDKPISRPQISLLDLPRKSMLRLR